MLISLLNHAPKRTKRAFWPTFVEDAVGPAVRRTLALKMFIIYQSCERQEFGKAGSLTCSRNSGIVWMRSGLCCVVANTL